MDYSIIHCQGQVAEVSLGAMDLPTTKLSIIATLPLQYPQTNTFVEAGASKLTMSNGKATFSM